MFDRLQCYCALKLKMTTESGVKNTNTKILEIKVIAHTNLCCLSLRRLILITRIASTARGVSKYVQAIQIIVWKLSDVMRDD